MVLSSLLGSAAVWGSQDLSAEEEFKKGLALYKEKKYAEAAAVFAKLEKDPPDNMPPEALFMRGQVARAMEKWAEAEALFSRATEAFPDLADYAAFYRGEALRMKEEKEKALQVFQDLILKHPQSLLIPKAQLQLAEIFLDRGDHAEAVSLAEQLIRENGNQDAAAQARHLLAQIKEKALDWPEAARLYQEVWLRHPLHPKAKFAKIKYETLLKEKKALPVKVPPEISFRRTQVLYQARQYDTALSEMEQLEGFPRETYPGNYAGEPWIDEFYFQRGMIGFWRKRFFQAEEAFQLVVRNSRQKENAEKAFYWRCRTLERLSRSEEVLNLAAAFPGAYPGGAYGDRVLHLKAQILEDRGNLEEAIAAYQEIAEKFPKGSLILPSLWKAGWLLFQKEDAEGAVRTWQAVEAFKPTSPWSEKALYWRGKALERGGKPDLAEEIFRRLRQEFPAAYHTQLAIGRGTSPSPGAGFRAIQDVPPAFTPQAPVAPDEVRSLRLKKGRILTRLHLLPEAIDELEATEGNGGAGEEMRLEVSRLFREMGEYHRSNLLVRRNFALRPLKADLSPREHFLQLLAYPLGNPHWINKQAESQNLDPALLSAVILEESRFDPQALSVAGARGLMQIMPGTGKDIAKSLKVRPYGDQQLYNPELNIRFGSWYLARLLAEFEGKTHLAVAAYNAGPRAVRDWLTRFPGLPEDEFVEKIPYVETRNYVVRVLTSRQVYNILYR
ncbi:MAG: lytic transglycosylase domain protein [Deltaproteobacteria bacterium]|nr:lytic transglycosylase domain protein [Deltaproteobacteria bacterium]